MIKENKPAIAQMQSQWSELQKLVELQVQATSLQTQILQTIRSEPAMSSHHVEIPWMSLHLTSAEFRLYH